MFRAVRDFDISDSLKCISLNSGDQVSAVQVLYETWYIGFNERTKKTGVFPATCVEPEGGGNDYTPLPVKHGGTKGLPEAKQIQERTTVLIDEKQTSWRNSKGPLPFCVNTLRKEKPKKSIKQKSVKHTTTEEGGGKESKAEEVFSQSKSVRFHNIRTEHSLSIPEAMISWHNSSFEDSLGHQPPSYKDICNGTTKVKNKKSVKNENSDGSYNRLRTRSSFRSSIENLFKSSKEEKKCMKAIFGVISGVLIGALMFLVFHFNFGYTLKEAGIFMAFLTVMLCIGMAVSSFVRCIIALVVPNFFTGIGRTILLSAIFALILNHPVSNISNNARETGRSLACVAELAANQTRALQHQFIVSIENLTVYVWKESDDVEALTNELHLNFSNAIDVVDQLSTSDEVFNVSRQKCLDTVKKSFEKDCNRKCDSFPAPATKLCKHLLCGNMVFSESYDEIKLGVGSSDIAKENRSVLNGTINHEFDVDMIVSGNSSFDANNSKPAIEEDTEGELNAFDTAMLVIRKCLSFSLLLVFLKSFWYLRNYLAKDGYDNIYITKQFREMDKEAEKNGRETVLPLKTHENGKYVNTLSFRLNATELSYSKLGLIQVFLHFLLYVLVITFDCALYYILNKVKEYGDIELEIESDVHMNVAIDDNRPMADFYSLLLKGNNLSRGFNMTINTEPCLLQPKEPSVATVPIFLVLYLIALAVVVLRAYGMRLRRKVSAYYYPDQELARLEYLHKKIRHKRLGFLIFLRQQIKSSHKEEQVKNRLRLSSWLAFNFPLIAKIYPRKNKMECTGCGHRETIFNKVKLTKCNGAKEEVRCDAVYCQECFTALQENCPLCSIYNTV